jgi:hypothetical protein
MGANAQTSVPAFTSGQVLTAAQVTQINTGIPVFASSTERDAAFGGAGEKTLAEGQMAYLEDTNVTQYYDGSSWLASGGKILQVVQTAKTDVFTTTSATFVDVTGLSVSITPTSATSKVLVMVYITGGAEASNGVARNFFAKLLRDTTDIFVGSAGSRTPAFAGAANSVISVGPDYAWGWTPVYLDSPATTSATTYKVQVRTTDTSYRAIVNRSPIATDTSNYAATVSSITAMEVSA